MDFEIKKAKGLKGIVNVPGDKSISHRSIMLSSISKGKNRVKNFLMGEDCISTINAFKAMGIDINRDGEDLLIIGKGLHGLRCPDNALDMGNSGTTSRLLSGILSGQAFSTTLFGDESLQKRPMKRIMEPLSLRGADICSVNGDNCLPLHINPSKLKEIDYLMPVSSAQVKSCLLLSGLYADGQTLVREKNLSRDHTERMLKSFGCKIESRKNDDLFETRLIPGNELESRDITVPSDISSAAYFLVAGLICENSEIRLPNININPTRAGIIRVIEAMNGQMEIENRRIVSGEEVADITVRTSSLKGTVIEKDIIPSLIDEIPVIAVLAAFADGQTIIRDASELKVKESDRIQAVSSNLSKMGADIKAMDDGFIINGGKPLNGTHINTFLDHRIAMSFAVCGLASDGTTTFDDINCVKISYPDFFNDLQNLVRKA